ncbi:MAG: PhoPQ-activated protein PqaA family protein [Planctomycetota bacterium]
MKMVRALALLLGFCVSLTPQLVQAQSTTTVVAESIPTALADYVKLTDNSFSWKLNGKSEQALGRIYDIELISQTWMDMPWKHVFMIYEPKKVVHQEHVLLFITGGGHQSKPNEESRQLGLMLATLTGARIAMLHQVPNQPLLGGRTEDDLITDTFLFYLATGDKRWPLLFPMVKSAVKAMDAVEQIAAQEWKQPVKGFVLTGASKRGWTTWLTGATDKRVVGIAPMVIDTLNFQKQMDYQIATWGKYSEQIEDYTRKGLVQRMHDEKGEPLWKWVDPYTYRSELTIPKLLVNGTNDQYWTVDALNNYWDDLPGTKYIRYVPNAGHNLKGGREAAMTTMAVFFQHVASNKSLPVLQWEHVTQADSLQLKMKADVAPTTVKLWVASSATKDFREAEWKPLVLEAKEGEFLGTVPKPQSGHVALYGELHFQSGPLEYSLTTQLRRE